MNADIEIEIAWPKKTPLEGTPMMSIMSDLEMGVSPRNHKTINFEPTEKEKKEGESGPYTTKKIRQKVFQPQIYKFKKGDFSLEQQMFREQFYEHGEANKARIHQQLVELTYLQTLRRFEKVKKVRDIRFR